MVPRSNPINMPIVPIHKPAVIVVPARKIFLAHFFVMFLALKHIQKNIILIASKRKLLVPTIFAFLKVATGHALDTSVFTVRVFEEL